ncbi:type I-B CRISPR-associated endonuclease Cas1b [Flammeovirga sp. EKP202]|uniref:type I-B CRISPR-associated endonuclease Cas1b n=1 Tax=Flammeovirga sp. EKP202 TaxID=2770592 RepID=UPI00165EE631|nr:type I-B CRISPR-associated endonuclease Cas1b [Flammeovirga sp. EKP202]MBD0405058.1 type I-B CRISPR-associated endonuclease Cas1 [Flammeovirga sp. EKP202]
MKKPYYFLNPGRVSRKDNTLRFKNKEGKQRVLPVTDIESIYCFGELDANTSFYNFMGKNGIPVHFFDYYEHYTGSFYPKEKLLAGQVQVAQTLHYHHKAKRIVLAQRFVDGASSNILKNLQYYRRRGMDQLSMIIEQIEELRMSIPFSRKVPELMGIEGNIRQVYYQAFDLIIKDFRMDGRSKQPPKNEVNALISFGNMMCYTTCMDMLYHSQLNPTISFLHEPGMRRYSLALDLAEIFKPILVDRLIFSMLNKRVIQEHDFQKELGKCVLKDSSRQKFLEAYDSKLKETIKHRDLQREVSYKRLVLLECYKLIKHILDVEEYQPFKIWW